MKQSYVYILKCSDDTYYTGVTSNLVNRIFKHESGFHPNSYTYDRRPLELDFYCLAIEEKQIKNGLNLKNKIVLNI